MRQKFMPSQFLLGLLALAVLLPAAAQAREDDFDFARKLVEKKFYDLAKEQFEGIVNDSGRPGPERANGELGLAYLLKAKADDLRGMARSEVEDVIAAFEEAEVGFDGFIEKNPRHPKLTDARFEVGLLLQSKGTYLTLKMEDDPGLVDALQPKAEEAFEQTIDLFLAASEGLQRRLDDMDAAGKSEDEIQGTAEWWDKSRADFYHCVAHYYKGSLYKLDSPERADILDKAIKLLDTFVWEHEEDLLGCYAFMYRGLCHKELGQTRDAIEWLSNAYSYMIPDREEGGGANYRKWTDVYLQAYYKLGEYCNELGAQQVMDSEGKETTHDYRKDAVKAFDEMRERIPDCEQRLFGLRSLLECAKALTGLNDFGKALDLATLVSVRSDELRNKEDWAAVTAFLANQLLNEIIFRASSMGKSLQLDPEVLVKAAEGKKATRDWAQAIRAYQKVVEACDTPESVKEHGIDAWMQIGECYYRRDQYLEAHYLYDYLVGLFRASEPEAAGEAAYYRYRSATALFSATRDPADGDLKKRARSAFAKEFPTHPRSIDLQYYEGADTIADADAKSYSRNETARGEAKKLYETAIKLFLDKVGNKSVLYEKARARKGEVLYKLGAWDESNFDKALEEFEWVMKYEPATRITREDHKSNRIQAKAISTYYGALCLTKKSQWQRALDQLKPFEETFPDPGLQDNFLPAVLYTRLQAQLQLNDIAGAEEELKLLRARYDDALYTANSLQMLGSAFLKVSTEAKRKYRKDEGGYDTAFKQDPEWRSNLEKSVLYFTEFLRRRANPKAREWSMIGISNFQLGRWNEAEVGLKSSDKAFDVEIAALPERDINVKKDMLKEQETVRLLLSKVLITLRKFKEAQDYFENLLCRNDKGARKQVREMLARPDFDTKDLEQFRKLVRGDPSLLEGLARIYMELNTPVELRRAKTLINILEKTSSSKYSEQWWNWKVMTYQIWLLMGTDKTEDDLDVLKKIIESYEQFESLGVMPRSNEQKDQMKQLYDAAKDEINRRR